MQRPEMGCRTFVRMIKAPRCGGPNGIDSVSTDCLLAHGGQFPCFEGVSGRDHRSNWREAPIAYP